MSMDIKRIQLYRKNLEEFFVGNNEDLEKKLKKLIDELNLIEVKYDDLEIKDLYLYVLNKMKSEIGNDNLFQNKDNYKIAILKTKKYIYIKKEAKEKTLDKLKEKIEIYDALISQLLVKPSTEKN